MALQSAGAEPTRRAWFPYRVRFSAQDVSGRALREGKSRRGGLENAPAVAARRRLPPNMTRFSEALALLDSNLSGQTTDDQK
jgi:hypothetical protein